MKTVLLVGAGSVKNGWEPIHTALAEFYPHDIKREHRNEIANLILAQAVYLARFEKSHEIENDNIGIPHRESYLQRLSRIKKKIYEELQRATANNLLTVQPEFEKVVEIVCENVDQLKVISTNWDKIFDEALIGLLNRRGIRVTNQDILHIHGEIDFSEAIYLPSEVIREPYQYPRDEQNLGKRHSDLLQYLQQTDRLIIYGLSLSSLDAELAQMIAAGISESNLKHIIIIDPNHSIVLEKIKILYGSHKILRIDSVWKAES